jgi:hypothetical protein
MSDSDEGMEMDPADPPGLLLRGVDHDGHYVLGFPVHVAVTVCADRPGTCLRSLPLASWAGNAGAIGVRLVEPETDRVVVESEPRPVVVPELGTSTFNLSPGACRRMLVDVSSFLPVGLSPARYDLTVIYAGPPDRVESSPMAIDLAPPSAEEREDLDRLEPARARAGSWGRWTNSPPLRGEPAEPPRGPLDPLRYNRVLRYLMYGPEKLSAIDPALVDVLHGVYEPESHALRAELYAARGDAVRFAEQAAIVRASYPGLAWWIDRLEAGRSELAFGRGG